MSEIGRLIDQALKEASPASGKLAVATAQRRVSRRLLTTAAMQFRQAARYLDEAVELLPEPSGENQSSE